MNDLFFMAKNKKGLQGRKLSRQAYIFCYKIKAQALHIINFVEIVYHQHKVLHIIKPQGDTRWRVMRYSPVGADDIHDCVVMIYQACGLDKKRSNFW